LNCVPIDRVLTEEDFEALLQLGDDLAAHGLGIEIVLRPKKR
jgi:hypothetical protein